MSVTFSIIVPILNDVSTIQRCIDSVHNQTHPSKELIIIDGGSTDGTLDVLKSNIDKIACWHSEPDNGISDAWNKGVKNSKGDWILFLGADDFLWENDTLEKVALNLDIEMDIVYGQIARMTNGEISCLDGFNWEHTRKSIIDDGICTFVHQGIFHNRALFEKYGCFDVSLKIVGDYEFLVRAFKDGGDAYFIGNLIVTGMQTGGITANTIKLVQEVAAARKKNNLKVITAPWLISYGWAIFFPLLNKTIGEKHTRHVLTLGKQLVMILFKKRSK